MSCSREAEAKSQANGTSHYQYTKQNKEKLASVKMTSELTQTGHKTTKNTLTQRQTNKSESGNFVIHCCL